MTISRLPREVNLLTPKEVAARFGVTRRTINKWVQSGKLPAVRTPGGQYRYERRVVEGLLERGLA